MKKLGLIFTIITAIFLVLPTNVVNAQAAQINYCRPGTGGQNEPSCVPCTPGPNEQCVYFCDPGTGGAGEPACQPCEGGPYGICIRRTGLILNEEGNIKPEFIVASLAVFGVGILLVLNGATLKKKLLTR